MTAHTLAIVTTAEQINPSIWKYILEPEQYLPYIAGQYLQVHTDANTHYYSIANAPQEGTYYELHIRHSRGEQPWVLGQSLDLTLPYGHCHMARLDAAKPILFFAAGTGFAPIRAMLATLCHRRDSRCLELYWGVANADDLYDSKTVKHWQQTFEQFQYFPHIAQAEQPGLVSRVLSQHPQDLEKYQVVMAGRFEYMYDMREVLLSHGLLSTAIFSDAFEFAR